MSTPKGGFLGFLPASYLCLSQTHVAPHRVNIPNGGTLDEILRLVMLSIIIVNWNTKDYLRRCLVSIFEHPPNEEWEVLVIDNGSKDGSAEMCSREFPEVRLFALPGNVGYAAGNNSGFRESRGELLLTVNPDTEFFDESLSKAVRIMKENEEVGALAGRLLNPDGTTQRSIRSFPTPLALFWQVTGFANLFPKNRFFNAYRKPDFDYSKEADVEQPMGSFLMFRRKALDEVGMMDERFPIFFNEVDLLYRMKLRGWKIRYSPNVQVIHHGGASTSQVRKAMIWESHRSLTRYYRKWYFHGWNIVLFPFFVAAVYIAAWIRARGFHAGFRPNPITL